MISKRLFHSVLSAIGFVWLLAACALNAPAGTAALSEGQAREIAEQTLSALNEGDYKAFSANFDDKLREAIDEQRFEELRLLVHESSGDFIGLSGPMMVKTASPQTVGYVYDCKFEKEDVVMTHTYFVDGNQIAGFFLNSPNLRKASQ
jgi:hypothetical protein